MIRYNRPQATVKKASPSRKTLALVVILTLLGIGIKSYWSFQLSPVDKQENEKQAFVIPTGQSTSQIVDKLYQEKLIRSPLFFKILIQQNGAAGSIQAGDFKLSGSMSAREILQELQSGAVDKWVTLLEGWRVEEMGEKLSSELGVNSEEFIKLAKADEGYLFPDTYLINKDATLEDIISILKNTFDQRYTEDLQSRVKSVGLTPAQGVILASIVEREARSDEVRQKVASILLKRFKIGMGLNADATVQYIVGFQTGEKSWWKRHLTRDDLKTESPYNTYLHAGFPPAPICNPSLSSLEAVAHATDTPYLYYYHDSKGNSYYGATLDEHNANIANHP